MYPLSWLNPKGLLQQNPTNLIAKMNYTEMKEAASQLMDMERENRGKGTISKQLLNKLPGL